MITHFKLRAAFNVDDVATRMKRNMGKNKLRVATCDCPRHRDKKITCMKVGNLSVFKMTCEVDGCTFWKNGNV